METGRLAAERGRWSGWRCYVNPFTERVFVFIPVEEAGLCMSELL